MRSRMGPHRAGRLLGVIAMGQSHPALPEGTRAFTASGRRLRPRFSPSLVTIVLLCGIVTLAVGEPTAQLSIQNRTTHAIQVVVRDRTFERVAPGAMVTYESGVADTVTATASYVAGQGVEGSVQRTFMISPAHGVNSGTTVYFACSTTGSLAPISGGPVFWRITADTLARR
jgi:hypothetical protein